MILNWALYKLKAFFLVFIHIFRKALCCVKKRRHSHSDSEPLTLVISNTNYRNEEETWTEWGEESLKNPETVQDYIEQYRQQAIKAKSAENPDESPENQLNFFEDMAPKITRQTKVLVKTENDTVSKRSFHSRLNAVEDNVNIIPSGELGEWDENNGWDGEQLLDQEAQKVLREQKRLERERRAWEQNQKRLEKSSRTLGSKLAT